MFPIVRAAFAAMLAVVLVGCATSSAIPLNPEASVRIQSMRAHVVIPQEEINVKVLPSGLTTLGGMVAGPVGILVMAPVDASVNERNVEKANLGIEPLRRELADFDFRAEFDKKLRTALIDLSWLKINQIEISGQPYSVDDNNRMRAAISQDSLLVMALDYQLSSDYRCLIVNGTATLWQRGQEEVQYMSRYRYISTPINAKKGEVAAKAWANNNAKMLRIAMQEGMDEMIRMFKLDFVPKPKTEQATAPLGADGALKVVANFLPNSIVSGSVTIVKLGDWASEVLAKDSNRVIYRPRFRGTGPRPDLQVHVHSTKILDRFGALTTAP